jgi:hypothetical protein
MNFVNVCFTVLLRLKIIFVIFLNYPLIEVKEILNVVIMKYRSLLTGI